MARKNIFLVSGEPFHFQGQNLLALPAQTELEPPFVHSQPIWQGFSKGRRLPYCQVSFFDLLYAAQLGCKYKPSAGVCIFDFSWLNFNQ